MNARKALMRKLSVACFALLEVRMFLDTHPNDREAFVKMKACEARAKQLTKEYEAQYGPLSAMPCEGTDTPHYCWLDDPWPWEYEKGAV